MASLYCINTAVPPPSQRLEAPPQKTIEELQRQTNLEPYRTQGLAGMADAAHAALAVQQVVEGDTRDETDSAYNDDT